MKPAAQPSLPQIEKNRLRLLRLNRVLYGVAPFLAVMAVGDLVHLGVIARKPLEPLRPDLKELQQSFVSVPSLEFPSTLFKPLASETPEEKGAAAPVVVKETQWKLLGVSLGGNKRAFLQQVEGGQSIWVGEGEAMGDSKVKEIRERSVILETGEKSYEIRM